MSNQANKPHGRNWGQPVATSAADQPATTDATADQPATPTTDAATPVATNTSTKQLQQAAGVETQLPTQLPEQLPIVPMAVGQKYLRRDGNVVMIVRKQPLGYFVCSDKWCYCCKTLDYENGWNLYNSEINDEDLVALLPIGAVPGNTTKN